MLIMVFSLMLFCQGCRPLDSGWPGLRPGLAVCLAPWRGWSIPVSRGQCRLKMSLELGSESGGCMCLPSAEFH